MRATRLVSLLLLLQTRGQLTAAEIADRLEISVRTVHRDMESLAAAGVPVEAVRGPAGGYRLAGGYRTRLTGLTADGAEDRVPHLPALSAAVWRGCRVRIRYREGRSVVQRTVDPLGLVLKGGAWYLIGRRSVGMRVYRVSRVASVRALRDPFERPAGFELTTFWDEWSRAFEQSRARVDVTVRVSDEVRRYLPGERRIQEDGSVVVAFEDLGAAYRELLRFGVAVEVLAPTALRERVAETGRELAALYGA